MTNVSETKRVKFTTSLNEELLKELKLLAVKQGKKNNELLEEAIKLLLEKYKKEGK